MKVAERLRKRIRELLTERDVTDVAFSKALGHTGAWASMFLGGKRGVPLDEVDRIAAFFEVDVETLFKVDERPAAGQPSLKKTNRADLFRHLPDIPSSGAADTGLLKEQHAALQKLRDGLELFRLQTNDLTVIADNALGDRQAQRPKSSRPDRVRRRGADAR